MGVCARYQACPKEIHLLVVKKIIKYVSGIVEFEIWYTHDTITILMGYGMLIGWETLRIGIDSCHGRVSGINKICFLCSSYCRSQATSA